tara:strand:+ start:44 stop:958 length:915 start_codon:yes stop_codon:yes gene_type:complete
MLNFKFIDIEELYLNKFKSLQEEENFWKKKYPHIFFPSYDFKKFENNSLYLEVFLPWHHEIVMLHNNLYNYYNLGKSIKASYESLSDKYLPEHQDDKNYTKQIINRLNKKVFFTNKGHEKFIKSFDYIDRSFNINMLESYETMSEKFLPQFSALIYVYFEKYLRNIVEYSTIPKKNTYHYDDKLKQEVVSREKYDIQQKDVLFEMKQKFKRLPTMQLYGKIIDQNCKLEEKEGLSNLLNKRRYRNFNKYRNCIIHSDTKKNLNTLSPLDCFYLQKEILDFICSNDKIIRTMEEVENSFSYALIP